LFNNLVKIHAAGDFVLNVGLLQVEELELLDDPLEHFINAMELHTPLYHKYHYGILEYFRPLFTRIWQLNKFIVFYRNLTNYQIYYFTLCCLLSLSVFIPKNEITAWCQFLNYAEPLFDELDYIFNFLQLWGDILTYVPPMPNFDGDSSSTTHSPHPWQIQ